LYGSVVSIQLVLHLSKNTLDLEIFKFVLNTRFSALNLLN